MPAAPKEPPSVENRDHLLTLETQTDTVAPKQCRRNSAAETVLQKQCCKYKLVGSTELVPAIGVPHQI